MVVANLRIWVYFIFLTICVLGITTTTEATSYPSDRVLWNDNIYDTLKEIIPMDRIGQQIGEVKRNVNPMPKKNGDSNTIPVGTKLFEIKGISTKEAIAVQRGGEYNKALNHGEFKSDETSLTMWYLKFLLTFFVILGLVFFMFRWFRKSK